MRGSLGEGTHSYASWLGETKGREPKFGDGNAFCAKCGKELDCRSPRDYVVVIHCLAPNPTLCSCCWKKLKKESTGILFYIDCWKHKLASTYDHGCPIKGAFDKLSDWLEKS